MRRAAELAADEPESVDRGFSDGEVLRIGKEVGLSDHHVRQALAEVKSGAAAVRPRGWRGLRKLFGPGTVWAARLIERRRAVIRKEIDNFMVSGQLLQAVRRRDDLLQYRPSVDWASRVARAASSQSRQHYVAAARMVEVRLEEVDEGSTMVEIHVDPGVIAEFRAGTVATTGIVGVGAGLGLGVVLSAIWPLALAGAAGVAVGSLGSVIVASLMGSALSRRMGEVQTEVEGILDALESGDGLEPPPPAWRRWVRRHFHGVAREILGPETD